MRLIVGDGAVARALAGSLARMGEPPLRWSRRAGGPMPPAEVVVLAVRDEAIAPVAAQVMAAIPDPILLHCAGALRSDEPFAELERRPRGMALLHPLRSFSGASEDVALAGTVFGIEGDELGRKEALAIVSVVGGVPLQLDAGALGRYHAAAALVSNATVGLVDAGAALLPGLDRAQAVRALTALLASTVKNLEEQGLPQALTGPISRGDVAVVARHLEALTPEMPETRDLKDLYRATMRRVVEVATQKGRAAPEALDEIRHLLDGK